MRPQYLIIKLSYRHFYSADSAEFKKIIIHLYRDFKGKFRDSAAIAVDQGPCCEEKGNYSILVRAAITITSCYYYDVMLS